MANGLGRRSGTTAAGVQAERLWRGEAIAERFWKFYREGTNTRAITRLQFLEHVGYLLFLKLDHERAQRSARFAHPPVAPVGAWPDLALLSGDALHTRLANLMADLGNQDLTGRPDRQIASVVSRDAQLWGLDRMAELNKLIVEQIGPYRWLAVSQAELGRAFSQMLRGCRDDIDLKIETGQTLTPLPVLNAITKVLGVGPEDIVIDPACDAGTTLIAAYNAMLAANRQLAPTALAGADLDAQMCRLSMLNILFHTGRPFAAPAPIQLADTLKHKVPVVRLGSGIVPTVAICNPPFKSNGVQPDATMREDFWAYGDFPTNFLQHLAITLPQGARAAVFVPDGILFGGGAAAGLRQNLLKNCDVHTLLRLPTGLFHRKGVKSNILFFTKSSPSRAVSPLRRTCGCTTPGRATTTPTPETRLPRPTSTTSSPPASRRRVLPHVPSRNASAATRWRSSSPVRRRASTSKPTWPQN
ncbi:N-6 DNA methylase [Streptomyces sp. TR1341]|uniref:N-6 DNA methylase n=1 Tax=Streptomyces sp. TR1341 TaxID=2601266 RepID=UPI00138ADCEB|nr:N-6 DNA methylase [Streptomyces sp. TR1341]